MLPNNANMLAIAEQVVGLASVPVTVVATRTVPEGLAAIASFEPWSEGEHNAVGMAEFARGVCTGEVTRAVRLGVHRRRP